MDKKEEFIRQISNLTREQINELIQRKGKQPKKLKLFSRIRE